MKKSLGASGPRVAQLLPSVGPGVRGIYELTPSMSNEEVQQLAELFAALQAERSSFMTKEAWEFAQKVFAIAGNEVCADCGASELLTWASLLRADGGYGVVLCNECCGGHRSLGVHISQPLSLKMDTWSDEKMELLLRTGNAKLNAVYEAHTEVARLKPGGRLQLGLSEVEAKHAYIRSKYEALNFAAGGSGELLPPRAGNAGKSSGAVGTEGQVHAGIVIVRVLKANPPTPPPIPHPEQARAPPPHPPTTVPCRRAGHRPCGGRHQRQERSIRQGELTSADLR